MTSINIYETGLDQNTANFVALSPISFIARTAFTYPDQCSIIHGSKRFTWKETYTRTCKLASALQNRGIKPGQTVAIMGSNTPEMYEAAFGVPMAGLVLNTLNVRLDASNIAFCLNHGEAKILIISSNCGRCRWQCSANFDQLSFAPTVTVLFFISKLSSTLK